VLDEPTNDLDLETLDLLQEMIADYDGTAIVISHDRDFLDRVATLDPDVGRRRALSPNMPAAIPTWWPSAGAVSTARRSKRRRERTGRHRQRRANASRSAKMSFKEKHALETLPKRIDELTGKVVKLQKALADPALFGRNPKRFADVTEQLSAAGNCTPQGRGRMAGARNAARGNRRLNPDRRRGGRSARCDRGELDSAESGRAAVIATGTKNAVHGVVITPFLPPRRSSPSSGPAIALWLRLKLLARGIDGPA